VHPDLWWVHTVNCTPCRQTCFGVACLLQNVCITIRGNSSQTDIIVTLTAWQLQNFYSIFLSFFSLSPSNVCFRKTQKLILFKLCLEFLLSRRDTLIKLLISGLSQYTKHPSLGFYATSVFWRNDEKENPLHPVPRQSCP
jgi:hypothetical protein